MIPGTMSGTSAMPYQRLRSGTSLRSTAQAIAVPIAKATTADPPAYASEFARSSNDAWSVSTRANHLVVNWKSKTLPPDENAPSTRMASGKSVRYARTAIGAATITTSAPLVGGQPLHQELARVRVRRLVREGHRLHVRDDRVGPRPVDRLLVLVFELCEPVTVRRERRGELAGGEEVRHLGVPAPERRLVRG